MNRHEKWVQGIKDAILKFLRTPEDEVRVLTSDVAEGFHNLMFPNFRKEYMSDESEISKLEFIHYDTTGGEEIEIVKTSSSIIILKPVELTVQDVENIKSILQTNGQKCVPVPEGFKEENDSMSEESKQILERAKKGYSRGILTLGETCKKLADAISKGEITKEHLFKLGFSLLLIELTIKIGTDNVKNWFEATTLWSEEWEKIS